MKTKRKEYDKFCSAILNIREQVFKSLKELIHSLGNHIVVPSNIDKYVYNAIAYNGGNHPEYATDCYARFDTIWYDANDDSIFVNFECGGCQELSENSIDDVLIVMDVVLTIIEEKLINKED